MRDFQPLANVKVLDFSHVIAGPMATFYLSQFGASVQKIEARSGGDVMRRSKPETFVALNAGKQSMSMDLRNPEDLAQLKEMAGVADVVVDSLRPGVLDKFGLGADQLRAANPRLVYCTVSGYGRRGAWANRPAYDHVIQAATGMAMLAGREGDGPIKTGFPVIDAASGMLAALAIVAALHERDQTGLGRYIDVAMSAAAMQLMYPMACTALTRGTVPERIGNRGYSLSPAADMFQTQDGWIAIGANTPRQFMALLKLLNLEWIGNDSKIFEHPLSENASSSFLRAKDPALLRQLMSQAFAEQCAADFEEKCAEVNVAAAKVRTLAEFADLAQRNDGLGMLEMTSNGISIRSPGLGFRVS